MLFLLLNFHIVATFRPKLTYQQFFACYRGRLLIIHLDSQDSASSIPGYKIGRP